MCLSSHDWAYVASCLLSQLQDLSLIKPNAENATALCWLLPLNLQLKKKKQIKSKVQPVAVCFHSYLVGDITLHQLALHTNSLIGQSLCIVTSPKG